MPEKKQIEVLLLLDDHHQRFSTALALGEQEKFFTTTTPSIMKAKNFTTTAQKLDAYTTILLDIPIRDAMEVETSFFGRIRGSQEPSSNAMPSGPKTIPRRTAANSMISSSVLDHQRSPDQIKRGVLDPSGNRCRSVALSVHLVAVMVFLQLHFGSQRLRSQKFWPP
jgi:hypothetical protein